MAGAGVQVRGSESGQPVAGGDISAAWRIAAPGGDIFLKTGPITQSGLFEAEADGLAALRSSNAVRCPAVLGTGGTATEAWIALEWLDLTPLDSSGQAELGRRLAEMHRCNADRFGWHRANYIGRTPQPNEESDSWIVFWRERRLRPQLELAQQNGGGNRLVELGDRLLDHCDELLGTHSPTPALQHGDLWGGNAARTGSEPVLFDPAVYFGDRETDLAMTRLFGGFSDAFYASYEEVWPLPPGWQQRITLYQLYHVLNHFNLFGGGYLSQAERMIQSIVSKS